MYGGTRAMRVPLSFRYACVAQSSALLAIRFHHNMAGDNGSSSSSRGLRSCLGCSGCSSCSGCATIFMLAVLGVGIYFGVRSCNAVDRLTAAMSGWSFVQSTVSTTLTSALGDLEPQGGFLVGWRTIDTRATMDSTTRWLWIPVGAVHIELDVTGNLAQYLIPTSGGWNAQAISEGVVVMTVPPPIVNDKVVEVQSDPAKIRVIIDNDWAEHLIPSGSDIDKAKRLLRASVIETASSKPALAEVRLEARAKTASFFTELFTRSIGRPITVIVQFSDELPAATNSTDLPK